MINCYAQNRSFKYGDGLFETMRVSKGQILFFDDHYARLQLGFEALGYYEGRVKKQEFYDLVYDFIKKHQNLCADMRVRVTFFRKGGGLYTPNSSKCDYAIEYKCIDSSSYIDYKTNCTVDLVPDLVLSCDAYSNLKTTSALAYVLAGLYKKRERLNDVLLQNAYGYIAEAQAANVFVYKNGYLYTPSLDQGCIKGVMREQILKLGAQIGLKTIQKEIKLEELYDADEIILTNTIQGLRSVTQIRGNAKVYNQKMRRRLLTVLNTSL